MNVHLCKYSDNNKYFHFRKRESVRGYHLIAVHLEQAGDNTFSIVQRDRSEFLDVINFKYSAARFIIVKLKNENDIDGGIEWINGKQESFGKEYYIECENMKKGKYYCFIEYDWEENIK